MDNINTTTRQESFKKIDYELGKYYQRFGVSNYYNEDGRGIFMQSVIDEELDDDEISIDDEFNKPTDCAYVTGLMDNFPIPPYLNISNEKKEIFKFYIVYACFRNVSPSDEYIMKEIMPNVDSTVMQYDEKGVSLKHEITRKLNDFIQSWNANPQKSNLDFNHILDVLLDYCNHTECHSKCCFKSFLNKKKCYIKAAAVNQLFEHIIQDEKKCDKMNDSLDELNKEIKDESKTWKDMYVAKILNDKKMTKHFDNSFVNLSVYMKKWLFIYDYKKDCGIITKCQDSIRKASIVVTNFNFCNGTESKYVIKETTLTSGKKRHYIFSNQEIEQNYWTAKLPQTPKPYLIPDEKQQANIKNILTNIKERNNIINQLKIQYEKNELNIFGKKRKHTHAISYSWEEFIDELEESCKGKMKHIRLEPVLAFDQDGYEACIEYVWVIPIKSKTNANECNHIGISVFLLNSECVASSLYLSIYDEQKLILIDPKDVFNAMDIEIKNNDKDIPERKRHSHSKQLSKRKHSKAKSKYNKKPHRINNQSTSQIIQSQLPQNQYYSSFMNQMLVQPIPIIQNQYLVPQTHLNHSAQPFTPTNNPKSNDVLDTVDENSELKDS